MNQGSQTKRILYVDDQEDMRFLVSAALLDRGFELETAIHGKDALEKIEKDSAPYDLVMTDNQMPVMDGIEFVRSLRSHSFGGKIVALSGNLNRNTMTELILLKVDRILYKPCSVDHMIEVIDGLLK